MSMSETTKSTVTLGDVQFDPVDTQDFRLSVEGTSGTGKSNTLAVILEDLANVSIPTLIIERLGALSPVRLEDEDIVVVGAREEEGVDLAVGLEDLDQLGSWVLDRGMKILLDVSTYADYEQEGSRVHEAAARAVRSLNDRAHEKYRSGDRTKSLLAVDEAHYMAPKDSAPEPELDEHVKRCRGQLIKVATEGGNKGISVITGYQRRAFLHNGVIQLAQDFIAHRPGDEDIGRTAKALRCSEDELANLGTGEILARGASITGGDLIGPTTVRKRRSPDPREESFELPETPEQLSEVLEDIQDDVEAERERREHQQDELERLREENDRLREEKGELEAELSDTSRIADALQNLGGVASDQSEAAQDVGEGVERLQEQVAQLKGEKADLQATIDDLEADLVAAEERNADLEARLAEAEADVEHLGETLDDVRSVLGVEANGESTGEGDSEAHREITELRAELEDREETIDELRAKVDSSSGDGLGDLITHDAVQAAVDVAKDNSDRADEHFDRVLAVLTSSDGGPLAGDEIAPLTETSESNVKTVLRDLFDAGVVQREKDGRSYEYELDRQFLERRIEVSEQQLST
jgi:biotin operon repressor/chaperonin cofactor prefoldin